MPGVGPVDRQRRIVQLSQEWGVVLPRAPFPLVRPVQSASFRTPNDDQIAESQLQRKANELSTGRPKSGLSKAFSTNNLKKGKNWDPKITLDVLNQWVDSCGSPGVAQALIAKLEAAGVELGGAPKQKSGLLSRRKSLELGTDRSRLLRTAVEKGQFQMVQILLPHADPAALDESLPAAIRAGDVEMVELLLQYGANLFETADGQDAFRRACIDPKKTDLISLILQSDGKPNSVLISEAMIDATVSGCLQTVLLLSRSTADGNHNQAAALKSAIDADRRDIAVAIIMGNRPPQSAGLDDAFLLMFEHPSLNPATKVQMAELLLCAGAHGDVIPYALHMSCKNEWYQMASLLASYGASIEYDDAAVVKAAIAQEQLDLLSSLLTDHSTLKPTLASRCVGHIHSQASSSFRYAVLELLLRKGAGGDALHAALIQASKAGDMASVSLLLDPNYPPESPRSMRATSDQHETASVDFQSGEALKTAVICGDIRMAEKMLAARPSPQTLSNIFPLTYSLDSTKRHEMMKLFLNGPLVGPSLHTILREAISEQPPNRDDVLIDLLLQHGADVNVESGAGLEAVIIQKDIKLLARLIRGATPQTAAARLPDAMHVTNSRLRHDMMAILFKAGAAIGTQEVIKALVTTLQERPTDMSLLHLILQYGQPEVDAGDGAIIKAVLPHPDASVLGLVLKHGKLSSETPSKCLKELAPLPSTEEKAMKLEIILSKCRSKENLDWLLQVEVQSFLENTRDTPSAATLKKLLAEGADPNANNGAALQHAVRVASIHVVDLLFQSPKPPSSGSLGYALPHALRISDPMDRLSFTKKLVSSGTTPAETNRALVHTIKAYPQDVSLISCLSGSADTSDGDALIKTVSNESPELLQLLLDQTKHSTKLRNTLLASIMTIQKRNVRLSMCQALLRKGVSPEAASNALLISARDADLELGHLLISSGADISTKGGQAIIEACRGGSPEVLRVLLKSGKDSGTDILAKGFQAATELRDLSKRAAIFELLLSAGSVASDILDHQLLTATRYGRDGQEILKILLKAGADPNYQGGEAVVAAASSASIETLEILLGLWIEESNKQKSVLPATLVKGLQASWALNRDSRYRVIEDLFKAGLPATEHVHIVLSDAVNEDPPEERLIKLLLEHGASPSTNGCKALIDATIQMNSAILPLLLDRDIPQHSIDQTFLKGFSSESQDIWFSDSGLAIAQALLEKGATGDALSETLVLAMTAAPPDETELADLFVELLVAYGANVNYNQGEPLRQAASLANLGWVKLLLTSHPSPDTLSSAFQHIFDTSLAEADALQLFQLFSDYHEGEVRLDAVTNLAGPEPVLVKAISQYPRSTLILQTLLDAGCYHDQMIKLKLNPEIEGEEDATILIWSISQPQKRVSSAVIQLLIDRGANVNVQTQLTGTTPLMLAIQTRRPDVVKALLLEGADVDVVDGLGRSPLAMTTATGGESAVEMMSYLLAADPSGDDGSLHNAARDLNLSAVKALVQAGHNPDFPSPLHDGRSALAEVCLHGTDHAELTADREKLMTKVMNFLINAGSDLTIKADGKSILHLCFEAADPVGTSRVLLKAGMWKNIKDPLTLYVDGELTYSPTMYVTRLLPKKDFQEPLLKLLYANRAVDVYYANEGPQPSGAVGIPESIKARERELKERQERQHEEAEDFARALARKRELANVEQQIWQHKVQMEDARRMKLHNEDLGAIRSRAALEDSLSAATTQRRVSEQRALQDAAISRTRAIAAAELDNEDKKQAKMLEWETRMNTEKVDNERALSAVRIGEREELERLERVNDTRLKQRFEAQKKILERQEKLAKQITNGPVNPNLRQIGYVQEMN